MKEKDKRGGGRSILRRKVEREWRRFSWQEWEGEASSLLVNNAGGTQEGVDILSIQAEEMEKEGKRSSSTAPENEEKKKKRKASLPSKIASKKENVGQSNYLSKQQQQTYYSVKYRG